MDGNAGQPDVDQIGEAASKGQGCDLTGCGCRFPLSDSSPWIFCCHRRKPGSSYCAAHHAVCYLTRGGSGERKAIERIERLAAFVGGRASDKQSQPSEAFISRADRRASKWRRWNFGGAKKRWPQNRG
jgi:hypothetical protein